MSIDLGRRPLAAALLPELRHELNALRGNWFWFVLLGVAARPGHRRPRLGGGRLAGRGGGDRRAAPAWGRGRAVEAFWCRCWSGFFLKLLSGVLSIVVGLLFLRAPLNAVAALTLLLACYLMVGGMFKIVAAASYRFAAWGWSLAGGIIDMIIGLMIWQEWPASALWVIGLFVGIDLLFRRFNWIALGMALRSLPRPETA